jgi:hypothetical protein
VTWEESGELGYAEGVSGLETSEEGRVDVGCVGGVAVTIGDNAGVDTCRVAVYGVISIY